MNNEIKKKSREEIAIAYKSEPWWYDLRGLFILTFAYRSTLWEQVRFFGDNIKENHLEVAIGSGSLFDIILKWRKWKKMPQTNIIGIDYAEAMLQGAKKRFSKCKNIELKLSDVAELPFPNNSFDSINIANAVHCFPDVDSAFVEVMRVLKPEGTMAANVLLYPQNLGILEKLATKINHWGIKKGILVSPYQPEDIRNRLQAVGAKILSEKISGNTYNIIAKK